MITNDFQELTLSRLGFGTMRLPVREDKSIDEKAVDEMIDCAIGNGVNYFDTAYPYHSGLSEKVVGRSLRRYPKEKWLLATKYPGHQIAPSYDPADIFEKQLKKCGVEYFDFYLLHNVYENSYQVYTDKKWDILNYFIKQKELGRIRHLGFSSHGGLDVMEKFLDYADGAMEFCQIQLNYLDWTLQNAKEKYEMLTRRNIPVWVMEPIRGGRLANLKESDLEALKALRPDDSAAAWALRFLLGLPNVKMILSGMSSLPQMEENVRTFAEVSPLTGEQESALLEAAEGMKNSVPCTACRYCTDSCPMELDIPELLALYNDVRFEPGLTVSMRLDGFPEDKRPSACVGCGKCAQICPQSIDIPRAMKELSDAVAKLPSWRDICLQRADDAKKNG